MFDMQKLLGLVVQLAEVAEKRVSAAEQKAEAAFAKFQANAVGTDLDAKVKAAVNSLFPSLDTTSLEAAISKLSIGSVATALTGVDVPGIVSAITTATGVAADIVRATTQAHADALGNGASLAVATSAGKQAATSIGAPVSTATALSSVVATTVQVQKDTGASVAQVAAAAVAHDDNTDDDGVALPGTDPVAAALHAASDKGADESTASAIANAVAAVAPLTVPG